MHVCMYACMYVCMYACMYVCMYVCVHVCMNVCMHVHMHACMYICMYVCMYVYSERERETNTYTPYKSPNTVLATAPDTCSHITTLNHTLLQTNTYTLHKNTNKVQLAKALDTRGDVGATRVHRQYHVRARRVLVHVCAAHAPGPVQTHRHTQTCRHTQTRRHAHKSRDRTLEDRWSIAFYSNSKAYFRHVRHISDM